MTSLEQSELQARPTGRVIVLFTALTAAAVALTLIAAYWHHDGAEALGHLGGGMFGAALTFLLLSSARPIGVTDSPTGPVAVARRSPG